MTERRLPPALQKRVRFRWGGDSVQTVSKLDILNWRDGLVERVLQRAFDRARATEYLAAGDPRDYYIEALRAELGMDESR